MNPKPLAARTAAVAALALACASPASAQDWDWVVAPYLWASTIETDLNEENPPIGEETNFSSILDEMDGTFQLHVEGQGDRWGAFGDVLWLGLSSDREGLLLDTETDLDASVWDFAVVWNVEPERYEGLDLFAGLRYISAEIDVTFIPVAPAIPGATVTLDDTYNDLLVGARYTAEISQKWKWVNRVDGSFGDTDGTFNFNSMLAYETDDWGSWAFGWRYMHGELGQEGRDIDITLNGPIFSYAFGFR